MQRDESEADYMQLRAGWLLGISLAGLALVGVLGALPSSRGFMVETESEIIVLLNSMLGNVPLWDWFVILGAHPGILFGMMILLLGTFAVEGWRIRRSDYGRIYGYGLLVTMLALAVAFAIDVFSFQVAQRSAPWTVLGGLDDLRRFYTTDLLSMSLTDGYVDGNLVAWSCAVVLLRNRAPRTSWFMFAFIVIHAFAEISLGEQWPVAHLLAALTGASIGALGLMRQERVFANAERHMEDFFVSRAWRQLTPDGLSRQPAPIELEKPRLVLNRPRTSKRKRREDDIWLRLVRREVLPVISLQPGNYVLSRFPFDLGDGNFKYSPHVRFVRSPQGEVFVVKAAWRWSYPFRTPKKIFRYRLHARNTLALERLNFPVPRLFWIREGMMNLGMRRFLILVEEYLPGRPLDRTAYEETSAAIQLLARLHENRRIGWGAISEPGKNSVEEFVWTYLRPRIMYSLHRLERIHGAAWSPDLTSMIWNWFEAQAFSLTGPDGPPFRLIHGDVTRNNFIASPDSVKMLDLLTLRYDWAGWEIVKAVVSFSQKTESWRSQVWQDYFEEAGNARWREFLRQAGMATGYYVLWEYSHDRGFGSADSRYLPDPEMFRRRLYTLIHDRTLWGDTPATTDWKRLNGLLGSPLGSLDSDREDTGARIVDASSSG